MIAKILDKIRDELSILKDWLLLELPSIKSRYLSGSEAKEISDFCGLAWGKPIGENEIANYYFLRNRFSPEDRLTFDVLVMFQAVHELSSTNLAVEALVEDFAATYGDSLATLVRRLDEDAFLSQFKMKDLDRYRDFFSLLILQEFTIGRSTSDLDTALRNIAVMQSVGNRK